LLIWNEIGYDALCSRMKPTSIIERMPNGNPPCVRSKADRQFGRDRDQDVRNQAASRAG
jgi:hypothetical protein